MGWTQAVCDDCWKIRWPGREPVRMRGAFVNDEHCCDCGNSTRSGIYLRADPTKVKFPSKEE